MIHDWLLPRHVSGLKIMRNRKTFAPRLYSLAVVGMAMIPAVDTMLMIVAGWEGVRSWRKDCVKLRVPFMFVSYGVSGWGW